MQKGIEIKKKITTNQPNSGVERISMKLMSNGKLRMAR